MTKQWKKRPQTKTTSGLNVVLTTSMSMRSNTGFPPHSQLLSGTFCPQKSPRGPPLDTFMSRMFNHLFAGPPPPPLPSQTTHMHAHTCTHTHTHVHKPTQSATIERTRLCRVTVEAASPSHHTTHNTHRHCQHHTTPQHNNRPQCERICLFHCLSSS